MVNIISGVVLVSTVLSGASAAPQQGKTSQGISERPGRSAKASQQASFDPTSYRKKFVTCNAIDRGGSSPKNVKLRLAYLDINPTAKKTLVMVHGWPSLWTTYRNQITDLGKDYRIILPENRGYGDSEHPKDLQDSNAMFDFVNDIVCILDEAKVKSAPCIGNDFGAQVCWEAGRSRPDRFTGVFNVGIPYIAAATPFMPTVDLAKANPYFGYQVFLGSNPKGAAKELDDDVRSAIRSCAQVGDSVLPAQFLQKTDTFLGPWREFIQAKGLREIPFSGIMSRSVEDYMVRSYRKQGFYNTFNGYQTGNRKRTHDFEVAQGNFTISSPTFTLFPKKDPVADWEALAKQVNEAKWLTNHKTATLPTAHWPQEERPAEFNRILRDWLTGSVFIGA